MNPKNVIFTILIGLALPLFAGGIKGNRPIRSRYTLEIGGRHSYSSYLSPLVYHGPDIALNGSWRKKMPFDLCWEMEFKGGIDFSDARNPAKNASMLLLQADFSWGMERMFLLPAGIRLGFGAQAKCEGGVIYLRRNSNNPANALARLGIDATLSVSRSCRIGRLSVTPFEQFTLPTVGAFFCPEYGETYYEIYLGNRSGLVHCGWWGNNFGLDNMLGAEMNFGRRSLVLGWRCRLQTIHANYIDTQLWNNSAVIGISF